MAHCRRQVAPVPLIPPATIAAAFRGRRLIATFQHQWVTDHYRLAQMIARAEAGGVPVADATAAAFEGLCRAAVLYEPHRGRFAIYARYWIKRNVWRLRRRAAREARWLSYGIDNASTVSD